MPLPPRQLPPPSTQRLVVRHLQSPKHPGGRQWGLARRDGVQWGDKRLDHRRGGVVMGGSGRGVMGAGRSAR